METSDIIFFVFAGILLLFIYISNKKNPVEGMDKVLKDLSTSVAKSALTTVQNSDLGKNNTILILTKLAEQAVYAAEQAYKEDSTVDRSKLAMDFVLKAMEESKMEITEERKEIIKSLILASVMSLSTKKN